MADRKITPDEFDAIVSGQSAGTAILSPEEFDQAISERMPGKPGPIGSLVSGGLEGGADILTGVEAALKGPGLSGKPNLGRLAGGGELLSGLTGDWSQAKVDTGQRNRGGILYDLAENMRGASKLIVPPEERGRGGLFTEDVPRIGGVMSSALATGVLAPVAFALQSGGPSYFEVLAEGGSEDDAFLAFMGNAALSQLENIGAGGAFMRALKKLAGKEAGKRALSSIVTHTILGAPKEATTETLEQIGHDLILSGLTEAEVNVLDNALATFTDPAIWTVGALGGAAESAAGRAAKAPEQTKEIKAPEKPQEEAPGKPTPEEVDWAKKWLSKPEPKQELLPPTPDEALALADEAERAAGRQGVPGLRPKTTKRWGAGEKPSLSDPVAVPQNEDEAKALVDRLWTVGKDYSIPMKERMEEMTNISQAQNESEVFDRFNEAIDKWQKNNLLPKQIEEEVKPEPISHEHAKQLAARKLEAIGAAVGAEDADIESAKRTILATPEGFDVDEEFNSAANRLRGRGVPGSEAKQATPEGEPLLAPAQEEKNKRIGGAELLAKGPTQENVNAPQEGKVQQGGIEQRQEAEGGGIPAEAGRGDSSVKGGKKQAPSIVGLYAGGPSPFGKSRMLESASKTKKRFKSALKEWLVSGGNTPTDARTAIELAEGEIAVAAREAKRIRHRVESEMKKAYGSLSEDAEVAVRDAMQDQDALAKLPDGLREAVAEARNAIDVRSRAFVSEGIVKGKAAETFQKNEGQYLHGSYKAYQDPEWADKVPPDVRNRLRSLLLSYAEPLSKQQRLLLIRRARAKTSMDARKARWEMAMRRAFKGMSETDIDAELDGILQDAKESAENPFVHLSSGKLGRKDMSILKRRKGIPQELKDYLGEEKNPISNFVDTIMRQSQTLARHRQFVKIRAIGLQQGWLSEKRTSTNKAKFVDKDNRQLKPLSGLYTSPEVKKALLEAEAQVSGAMEKTARFVAGTWKRGKTIYNPIGAMKQVIQNLSVLITTGKPLKYPQSLLKAWKAESLADDPYIDKLVRLRVIQTGLVQSELNELHRAFKGEKAQKFKDFEDFLGRAYGLGDNAARVAVFEGERDALIESGYSQEDAEITAADIAKNIVPTPTRIAKLGKKLRPYAGFISYTMERFRTTGNIVRLAALEMKSGNEKMVKRGIGRIARLAVASSVFPAARAFIHSLLGIDDDEEADLDALGPEWARGRTKIYFGEKGNRSFFDLTQFDHMTWVNEPIMALLEGDVDKAWDRLRDEMVDPFLSFPFLETMTGKTAYEHVREWIEPAKKKPVFTTLEERASKDILRGLPGVGPIFTVKDFSKRLIKDPGDTPNSLLGVRSYSFDPIVELSKASKRAVTALGGTSQGVKKRLAAGDDEGAARYAQMEQGEIYEDLHQTAMAALRQGYTDQEVVEAFASGGMSKENAWKAVLGIPVSGEQYARKKSLELRREKAKQ